MFQKGVWSLGMRTDLSWLWPEHRMEDVGVLKRQPGGWVERGSQKALDTQKQAGFFRELGRKGCSVDGLPHLPGPFQRTQIGY